MTGNKSIKALTGHNQEKQFASPHKIVEKLQVGLNLCINNV